MGCAFGKDSQRVRIFGYLFERVRTFLDFPAWGRKVHSFRAQAAPSKNCKLKFATIPCLSLALQPSRFFEGQKRSFTGSICNHPVSLKDTNDPSLARTFATIPFLRRTQPILRWPQICNHPVSLKDPNDPSLARTFATIPFLRRTQPILRWPQICNHPVSAGFFEGFALLLKTRKGF